MGSLYRPTLCRVIRWARTRCAQPQRTPTDSDTLIVAMYFRAVLHDRP